MSGAIAMTQRVINGDTRTNRIRRGSDSQGRGKTTEPALALHHRALGGCRIPHLHKLGRRATAPPGLPPEYGRYLWVNY